MAKNFKLKIRLISRTEFTTKYRLLDICTHKNGNIIINATECHSCEYFRKSARMPRYSSCPKIIYRHANGKVVMRKK